MGEPACLTTCLRLAFARIRPTALQITGTALVAIGIWAKTKAAAVPAAGRSAAERQRDDV